MLTESFVGPTGLDQCPMLILSRYNSIVSKQSLSRRSRLVSLSILINKSIEESEEIHRYIYMYVYRLNGLPFQSRDFKDSVT